MIHLDVKSKTPIYEQIYEGFKNLILKEILEADDKMPSVRDLAGQLAINPNTIQKAYRQLEQEGYIYVVRGRGNFVNAMSQSLKNQAVNEVQGQLMQVIGEAKLLGMTEAELHKIIKDGFKEGLKDD